MSNPQIFRYRWRWIALSFSVLLATTAAYLFARAAESYRPGDLYLFVIGIPFVFLFAISAPISYRDVVVSNAGIRRSFFGLKFPLVRWADIVSVRCDVLTPVDHLVRSYHLRTRVNSPCGGVTVVTTIEDIESLVVLIRKEVVDRNIPVTAWDVNTLIDLDYLPSPVTGDAAWK